MIDRMRVPIAPNNRARDEVLPHPPARPGGTDRWSFSAPPASFGRGLPSSSSFRRRRYAQFLLLWVEAVFDPEAVGERTRVLVDADLEVRHPPGQVLGAGMAMMIGDVLAQPAPEGLDWHQVGAVARQRHQGDVQRAGNLPDRLGPVIRGTIPQHDQLALGNLGA